MNLSGVVYWFNPLVWYALKEMRNDREVACDTAVLEMLEEDDYEDYGNTLINFAEKISLTPFPFAAGLGGSMEQMKPLPMGFLIREYILDSHFHSHDISDPY